MVAQYTEQPKWADGDTLEWSGGAHCNLPSLVFNGECQQYGTPTPDNPIPIYSFNGLAYVRGRDSYLYTPYLNGIGSYRDNWDYVTGKGLRYIHKVELDGVSTYKKALSVSKASTGYYYCSIRAEYKSYHARYGLLLSTHFASEWTHLPGTGYMSGSGDYLYKQLLLYHTDQTLDTADKWNNWLKEQYANGTPVTIYYAMAEPIPFEERSEYDVYEPIPNDSGYIDTVDSSFHPPFNITYITHS